MRKQSAVLLILLILGSIVTFQFAVVKADLKTIVVPDDYRTITSAIGNATNGDTILVRKGNYQEHTIVINKTLTLIGEGKDSTQVTNLDNHVWNQATETLPPVSYAINVTADNVKISGFTITQATVGIYTRGNGIALTGLTIPNGEVMLNGSNQTFAYNTVSGFTSDVICVGSNNYLLHNNVDGGIQRGIITQGSNNIIYGNKIAAYNLIYNNGTYTNSVSESLMVSGDYNFVGANSLQASGVNIRGYSDTICGNNLENGYFTIVGNSNTFYGNSLVPKAVTDNSLTIPGTPVTNANQLPNAGISIANMQQDSSNNLFYENNFYGNGYFPVLVWSAARGPEQFDNGKIGNYWSNYNGTDSNGDGLGDTPYVIHTNDPQNNNNRTSPSNIANFDLTDNYPLISPIDTTTISIQLPSWANITATSQILTASFPAKSPSNSTTPIQSPSPSPTAPELSWLVTALFMISMFVVVLMLRYRKQPQPVNPDKPC